MENLEIFFSGNDELTEFEVQQKEYRNDIIVKVGKNLFQPLESLGSADGYNILKLGDRVEIYIRVKV